MLSLEEIGALLGFVAFAGLAVLVFLTFQQARHIRRLRDWAGRAPERAAAEAAREAGENVEGPVTGEDDAVARRQTSDEPAYTDEGEAVPRESRLTMFRNDMALRFEEFDRRSPVDAKILLAGFAVIIIGLAIATGGFGLIGGSDSSSSSSNSSGSGKEASSKPPAVKVAVLNGTAPAGGTGVPGVADSVSKDVEDAGFKVSDVGDAGSFTASVVMWRGNAESDAQDLADSMSDLLGDTEVLEMTPEVEDLVGKADVALIVGQDDSGT
jgi:hypothetical protein